MVAASAHENGFPHMVMTRDGDGDGGGSAGPTVPSPEAGESVPAAPLDPGQGGVDSEPVTETAEVGTGGIADGIGADVLALAGENPFHPLANIFPMLDEASQRAMTRDIQERQQLEPITLFQDKILDGRARYRACREIGRKPKFETYEGNNPLGLVISRNIHRRHLLNDCQRALVAARLANLPVGANAYSEGVSIDTACDLLKVKVSSVKRSKKILRLGIPEVIKEVEDGRLTIWAALRLTKVQAEMARLARSHPPAVEASNSRNSPDEPSQAQVEVSGSDSAEAEAEAQSPATERPGANQEASSSSTSSAGCSITEAAAGTAGSRRIPHYNSDKGIWPGYIPTSAVTVIAGSINAPTNLVAIKVGATVIAGGWWPNHKLADRGDVAWLSARREIERTLHDNFMAAGGIFDGDDQFHHVHLLEAQTDDFGLPIHHLARALRLLDQGIQTKGNVQVAIVDYLFPYVASGVEQNIAYLQRAIAAMNEIAVEHHLAVVAPCPFPYRGGRNEIPHAVAALANIPEVHSLLFVEGTDSGTIMPTKIVSGAHPTAVNFRLAKRPGCSEPSVPAIMFEDDEKRKPEVW
jgi:ParB-like chromosome segregation protein Spo0J